MPQIINTNIPSIVAQSNLDRTNDDLSVSLQRLSSGLRINSAKDDAAGLAISTRFVSKIQGSSQAQRNANDAISMSQLAESALSESTRLLQRIRVLAVQSANGSNSAVDRQALQAEVNQLQQEITRIGNSVDFNGVSLLNGSFLGTAFQVGTEQNQTVNVSIADARATALGANQITSNSKKGLGMPVNNVAFVGNNITTELGANVGAAGVATNGYAATTFTVSGSGTSVSFNAAANDSAEAVKTGLNAQFATLENLGFHPRASAFNAIKLTNMTGMNDTTNYTIAAGAAQAVFTSAAGNVVTLEKIASMVNATPALHTIGVYAVYDASSNSVDIFATKGHDLSVTNTVGSSVSTQSLISGAAATPVVAGTRTHGGRLDLFLPEGFQALDSTSAYFNTAFLNRTDLQRVGVDSDLNGGTAVVRQDLTVAGSGGIEKVSVPNHSSAQEVANLINNVSDATGVRATATTSVTLQNLKLFSDAIGRTVDAGAVPGEISFDLKGDNAGSIGISASLSNTGDLTPLLNAINAQSGVTNITAMANNRGSITLQHSTGANIEIKNVNIGYAKSYAAVLQAGGNANIPVRTASIDVLGTAQNSNGENRSTTLYCGGSFTNEANSTIVGGELVCNSSGVFNITSSLTENTFSLFNNQAPGVSVASKLESVSKINISTAAGAQSAIMIADQALDIINSNRANLGAVQNRFASSVRSLSSMITNLSSANSRIMDADFAQETANLTRAQILNQAGIAVLSQANQLPQAILGLLK